MKIGLTKTENPEKHQYYIDWLKGNENIEIVTLSANDDNGDKINVCDALVLSGGTDIDPVFYNGPLHYPKAPEQWNRDRDVFELSLLQSAINQSKPVLGICRGMQLINVAFHGTLVQNLGVELNKIHEGNPDKLHNVNIEDGSLLHEIAGAKKTEVNSAHHQAIDRPGEELAITARSDEGVAEAVEWKDATGKPFLLAIQWHPERMFKFQLEDTPLSKSIRERFISEIKKSTATKK
jgi:putative glutamine amidotransferase